MSIGLIDRLARFKCLASMLFLLTSCVSPSFEQGNIVLEPALSEKSDPIIQYDVIFHPVVAKHGMVVSQNKLASEVGAAVLEQGGNAVDAAIATGFALAVTLPRAGNIGGGGFSLVYLADTQETLAFDFRGVAPAEFDTRPYTIEGGKVDRKRLTYGPAAASVPGTVSGFHQIWAEHGSLPWDALIQPALELARDGITVTDDLAFVLENSSPSFQRFPSSGDVFLKKGSASFVPGERLVQADLAWSLELIASQGPSAFYTGEIAKRLVSGVRQAGGYFSHADLEQYKTLKREVISTTYRGYEVFSMPPPSSGGLALLQMLNVLERFPVSEYPQGSADSIHLLAEVMKHGAANRRGYVADPDFYDVPVEAFLNTKAASLISSQIDMAVARPTSLIEPFDVNLDRAHVSKDSRKKPRKESDVNLGGKQKPDLESRDTTHFSVVDKDGNAVSTTYTLGYSFGSGFVVPGTGILLDNQMRNFSLNDKNHPNAVAPGKRMASSMTPVIVLDESNKVKLVTGSPGGSRIINVVLQLLVSHIDHEMNVAEATQRPRVHQSWRGAPLFLEPGISLDTQNILAQRGHILRRQKTMGSAQTIAISNGLFFGAADSRRPGAAAVGSGSPSNYPLQAGDRKLSLQLDDGSKLPLWTHTPENISTDAPVMIVMHGMSRDADRYLHQWRDLADQYGFYLLVPEFSKAAFPQSRHYNLGNVHAITDGTTVENDRSKWSFALIERAFDLYREAAGYSADGYHIFGHSAGSQFVHRFLFFTPESRALSFVAANAGWYTMPNFESNWPYGLAGTSLTDADLINALGRKVIVLLGDQDTDTGHQSLRKTPEAMDQGPHRFARGHSFFANGRDQAKHLQAPFRWRKHLVPGVAHDNRGMAQEAVKYLFGEHPR